jgi:2-polyprenyl-3-methyl-5-hydroxy-6-metoxy-1,4-benzoquinol methylase
VNIAVWRIKVGRISFDFYGHMATQPLLPVQMAGRYLLQAEAERLMSIDIAKKLELKPDDTLLDIGCGPGANLIPLSYLVHSATGIDHPSIIGRLSSRVQLRHVEYIAGHFMDLKIERRFTKILVYSVIQQLESESEIIAFLERACDLLEPRGLMLVGDLPNTDLRQRFLTSAFGRKFHNAWEQKVRGVKDGRHQPDYFLQELDDPDTVQLNDQIIGRVVQKFRSAETHAWVLPQPPELPFGYTREDLVICKL